MEACQGYIDRAERRRHLCIASDSDSDSDGSLRDGGMLLGYKHLLEINSHCNE